MSIRDRGKGHGPAQGGEKDDDIHQDHPAGHGEAVDEGAVPGGLLAVGPKGPPLIAQTHHHGIQGDQQGEKEGEGIQVDRGEPDAGRPRQKMCIRDRFYARLDPEILLGKAGCPMYEEQIQTITAQVAEALAEQSLPFAPDQRAALELLRAPGWAEELAQLLPIRRRLECGEVLELCSPILPKLSPAPEDGWLSFCYRYIRSILYPEGDFAPDGEEYALSLIHIYAGDEGGRGEAVDVREGELLYLIKEALALSLIHIFGGHAW